jgi:hypothetical protein
LRHDRSGTSQGGNRRRVGQYSPHNHFLHVRRMYRARAQQPEFNPTIAARA